jgi:hypothetical protein
MQSLVKNASEPVNDMMEWVFNRKDPFARCELSKEQVRALQMGEAISLDIEPNPQFEAVKFVTLYAYLPIPPSSKRGLNVCIEASGDASFLLDGECTKLPQHPYRFQHSLLLNFSQSSSPWKNIRAASEDQVLERWRKNRLITGRSPYTTFKIQLKRKPSWIEEGQFFGRTSLDRKRVLQACEDKGLIKRVKGKFQIIKSWPEIRSVGLPQVTETDRKIVKALFKKYLVLFEKPTKGPFFLQLLGYGYCRS